MWMSVPRQSRPLLRLTALITKVQKNIHDKQQNRCGGVADFRAFLANFNYQPTKSPTAKRRISVDTLRHYLCAFSLNTHRENLVRLA
jgi:hypothetical protein